MFTRSDTTIKYFIVILLLATSFGSNSRHQTNIYKEPKMLVYKVRKLQFLSDRIYIH